MTISAFNFDRLIKYAIWLFVVTSLEVLSLVTDRTLKIFSCIIPEFSLLLQFESQMNLL